MTKRTAIKIIVPVAAVLCTVAMLAVTVISVFGFTNIAVLANGNDIRDDLSGEKYDCILVLGAGLRSDKTPSDMLADRLDVAIELYNSGVSDIIVLSGDFSEERDYDEVSAMERYCISKGIPAEAIRKDLKGYSTYESVFNLRSENKYESVVVVTQRYHLYRALYIAEGMEFEAVGADAATRSYRGQLFRDLREIAARTKDYFQVKFSY